MWPGGCNGGAQRAPLPRWRVVTRTSCDRHKAEVVLSFSQLLVRNPLSDRQPQLALALLTAEQRCKGRSMSETFRSPEAQPSLAQLVNSTYSGNPSPDSELPPVCKFAIAFPGLDVVRVPTDDMLGHSEFLQRLAGALASRKIPRRRVPDWMAERLYQFKGRVLRDNGDVFDHWELDLIDSAFGDDGSFRWVTNFLKITQTPWKQQPQKRILDRLRLIAIVVGIEELHPELLNARNFIGIRRAIPFSDFNIHSLVYRLSRHSSSSDESRIVRRRVANEIKYLRSLSHGWFPRFRLLRARERLKAHSGRDFPLIYDHEGESFSHKF